MKQTVKSAFIISCIACGLSLSGFTQNRSPRTLIIFFDGLRPDYIVPDIMPNLAAFRDKAAYGTQHHSVFPTVTRVNSASYATGSYPKQHGLLGNTVYFPQVDKEKGLNTGDAIELMRIEDATGGNLLTAISLGEILAVHNEAFMVFSSGSSGQALLQHHKVGKGGIINPELILPVSLRNKVMAEMAAPPAYAKPNTARHIWMVDAFLRYGTGPQAPKVCALWFSDPDATAHAYGIGAPQTVDALRIVDHEFGRVLKVLELDGGVEANNIIISTDHGFVTYVGKESIAELLIKEGLKKNRTSTDVVVSEGAIYVKNADSSKVRQIVALLQAQDWVGPIFTKPLKHGSLLGHVAGTLSFDAIHWNHSSRAADVLVDENWNDEPNVFGFKGSGYTKGVAGHGGASPYEINIPLIVSGPSFRKSYKSLLPTSNVDIVPTVLYLNGIDVPATMDGRVMSEMLLKPLKSSPTSVKKERVKSRATGTWGHYELELEYSVLGKYRYINFTRIKRSKDPSNRSAD